MIHVHECSQIHEQKAVQWLQRAGGEGSREAFDGCRVSAVQGEKIYGLGWC